MTRKECPVCLLLNPDPDFKNYIDSLLKRDTKISEVVVELTNSNYSVPSEHYLKKHKINCLKDFKVELPQPIPSLTDKHNIKNNETNSNIINLVEELEKYKNMSFQQKEYEHFKRLKEIKYMSSIIIYHQLLHGRYSKATIPKEDISALKQVEDILEVLNKSNEELEGEQNVLNKLSDEQIKIIAGWIEEADKL
jgi:predicted DNA binding protein